MKLQEIYMKCKEPKQCDYSLFTKNMISFMMETFRVSFMNILELLNFVILLAKKSITLLKMKLENNDIM